jgi:hypothetical protein
LLIFISALSGTINFPMVLNGMKKVPKKSRVLVLQTFRFHKSFDQSSLLMNGKKSLNLPYLDLKSQSCSKILLEHPFLG